MAWIAALAAAALLPLWPIYQFISIDQPGNTWAFSVLDGWSTESYVIQAFYYLACFGLALYAVGVYRQRAGVPE